MCRPTFRCASTVSGRLKSTTSGPSRHSAIRRACPLIWLRVRLIQLSICVWSCSNAHCCQQRLFFRYTSSSRIVCLLDQILLGLLFSDISETFERLFALIMCSFDMRLILNRYCMASRTHQAQCYRPHYVFCRPSVRLSVCRSCIRTTNLKTGKRKIRIFNPKGQPSRWPDVEKVHEIAAYWRICLRTDGGSGTDCKLST